MGIPSQLNIREPGAASNHWYAGNFAGRIVKVITLVRDPVVTNLSDFFTIFNIVALRISRYMQTAFTQMQSELLGYFLPNYPHNFTPEEIQRFQLKWQKVSTG